jgi:hypothetical protein
LVLLGVRDLPGPLRQLPIALSDLAPQPIAVRLGCFLPSSASPCMSSAAD